MADTGLDVKPPPTPTTKLFVHADGSPIRIFVEPTEINGRPRLLRTLRAGGADICNSQPDAQIIIVNQNCPEGRKALQLWGNEQDKRIIDFGWVRASVESGHALLDANCGGYLLYSDGVVLEDAVDDDDLAPPIAAFRTTDIPNHPVETRTGTGVRHHPVNRLSPSAPYNPGFPLPSSSQSASAFTNGTQVPDSLHHPASQSPSSASRPSFSVPPAVPQPPMPEHLSQQEQQPQSIQSPTNNITMSQQYHPGSQLPVNAIGIPHPQQYIPLVPFNLNPNDSAAMQVLFDTLRSRGIDPMQWAAFLATQAASSTGGFMMGNQFPQPNGFAPPFTMFMPPGNPGVWPPSQPMQFLPSLASGQVSPGHGSPQPSTSRLSSPMNTRIEPSITRRRKDGADSPTTALSPTPKVKRKAKASRSASSRSSASPEQSLRGASSSRDTRSEQIFRGRSGKQLAFFVQVDTRNRSEILMLIKKNGGKIVAGPDDADLVLLNPQSSAYAQIWEQAEDAGKLPLQTSYVRDCLNAGSLLDERRFLLPFPGNRRGRPLQNRKALKRESPESPVKKHRTTVNVDSEPENTQDELRSPLSKRKVHSSIKQSPATKRIRADPEPSSTAYANLRSNELRTPTPPGEEAKIIHARGEDGKVRYLYSEQDSTYYKKYAFVLLYRDNNASALDIGQKMHEKIPWHTARSWENSAVRKFDLEEIRKRAGIARRKADRERDKASVERGNNVETASPDRGQRPGPSSLPGSSPAQPNRMSAKGLSTIPANIHAPGPASSALATNGRAAMTSGAPNSNDLDRMVDFLSSGDVDFNADEDDLWAQLTRQAACQSYPSWKHFYEAHGATINGLVESKLTGVPIKTEPTDS